MKSYSLVLAFLLPLFILSCAKEEAIIPAQPDTESAYVAPQNQTDDVLESANACGQASKIDYDDEFSFPFPITFFFPCISEPVMVPAGGVTITSQGKLIVSAACTVNDKGSSSVSITGTGSQSGDTYSYSNTRDFHFNGSFNASTQTATISRSEADIVLTNETTGETYEGLDLDFRVVFNANGDLVNLEIESFTCGE